MKGLFSMNKIQISTDKAPKAIGPYSQAIKTQLSDSASMVFVSGQIAIDPDSGEIVSGSADGQIEQVIKNIEEVLKAAGSSLEDIVKNTLYLTNMDDFTSVNKVYEKYFSTKPPARACVEVSVLPKNVVVEMDSIAICNSK